MRHHLLTVCAVVVTIISVLLTQTLAAQIDHHGLLIDPLMPSNGCLGCHDGTIGESVSICTVECSFSDSHAIEKNYPPQGLENQYATVESLQAQGVTLQNGKIVCISCHNLQNDIEYHLTVPNTRSELCMTCHLH